MDINLSISPAPSIPSNYLVVVVYKTTAPTVVVDFQYQAAPHVSPWNVVFTDLDPGTYQVKTFENPSPIATGGTLRHSFFYDPGFSSAQVRPDLFLKVGTTPNLTAGETVYHDTGNDQNLAGWTFEVDLRQSFGELWPDVDTTKFADGFQLLMPGYTFQTDEIYILRFYPKITTITPPANSSDLFTEVLIITADTTLVAGDVGKAVHIVGANPALSVTLPALADIPANKLVMISSNGGNHKNVNIIAAGSDLISWLGADNKTRIILGQSEVLWLYRWTDPGDAGNLLWRVLNASDGIQQVGEFISDYARDNELPINTLQCSGQLISRTTYARLWARVQTLDADLLISDATWTGSVTQRARFSTGDGSTTFRLPNLAARGFERTVDGVIRKGGSDQLEEVGPHYHPSGTEPSAISDFLQGIAHTRRNWNTGNTNNSGLASTGLNSGTENRPANYGAYKLIRI